MKLTLSILSILVTIAFAGSASAQIVGSDFSDSAVFNTSGGAFDDIGVDDLDTGDNITVTDWSFGNTGGILRDTASDNQMPSDNVAKFNGASQATVDLPVVGSTAGLLASHSFSINIPAGTILDLEDVTFDWRKATAGTNSRWLAFNTSLDAGNIIWSGLGVARNGFDSESISLLAPAYQDLTNQTVTFNFYAGGEGTGDIDIDTIVIDGTAVTTAIPEPTSALGIVVVAMGFCARRRKN